MQTRTHFNSSTNGVHATAKTFVAEDREREPDDLVDLLDVHIHTRKVYFLAEVAEQTDRGGVLLGVGDVAAVRAIGRLKAR